MNAKELAAQLNGMAVGGKMTEQIDVAEDHDLIIVEECHDHNEGGRACQDDEC